MKRKLPRKSGMRQRAVLLPLETFLSITDFPLSPRHDWAGDRVKDKASLPKPAKQGGAVAHQPR
ncbi:MAG: hypothetical protein ACK41V_18340 [Acidovorax sp.]|uniref:hypothetical protein n=1 Tax=Acidovorax sp. TaxID=1872122 RepID=UPI00391A36FD